MDLTPWEPNQLQIAPVTHTHTHKHLSVHRQTQITPWIITLTHTHVSLECESYSVLRRLKLALKADEVHSQEHIAGQTGGKKREHKRTFSCQISPWCSGAGTLTESPAEKRPIKREDPPPGAVEAHHISRPEKVAPHSTLTRVCVCWYRVLNL